MPVVPAWVHVNENMRVDEILAELKKSKQRRVIWSEALRAEKKHIPTTNEALSQKLGSMGISVASGEKNGKSGENKPTEDQTDAKPTSSVGSRLLQKLVEKADFFQSGLPLKEKVLGINITAQMRTKLKMKFCSKSSRELSGFKVDFKFVIFYCFHFYSCYLLENHNQHRTSAD